MATATALLALVPAGAGAAAVPPRTLDAGLATAVPQGLVVTPRGSLVGTWARQAPGGDTDGRVLRQAPGAAAPQVTRLSAQPAAGIAPYGADHVALLTTRYGRVVGGFVQSTLCLRTAAGAGGAVSRSVPVVRDALVQSAAVAGATGSRPAVAVAWAVTQGGRRTLRYALRAPDGRLGTAHVVSGSGSIPAVALAFDGAGDLEIAYVRVRDGRARTLVRVARPGHGPGRETDLGDATGQADLVAAGQASAGRFVVAWKAEDPAEAGPGFAPRISAATRTAAGRWTPGQRLDSGGGRGLASGRLAATLGADGQATVAWSEPVAGGEQPRAAVGRPGSPLATSDLPGGLGTLGALAAAPAGGTAAVVVGDEGAAPLRTVDRVPGASTFGAPEALDAGTDQLPQAAYDPAGGLHVLWEAGLGQARSIVLGGR